MYYCSMRFEENTNRNIRKELVERKIDFLKIAIVKRQYSSLFEDLAISHKYFGEWHGEFVFENENENENIDSSLRSEDFHLNGDLYVVKNDILLDYLKYYLDGEDTIIQVEDFYLLPANKGINDVLYNIKNGIITLEEFFSSLDEEIPF